MNLLAVFILNAIPAVVLASTSEFTSSFQGCFGGPGADLQAKRRPNNNLNVRCIDYCRELAFPIAATQGYLCACSNSLLGLLPQVARHEDGNATGPNSPCNQRCPGTPGTEECDRDTCCGGGSSHYSVFTVGNIDTAKTILERCHKALTRNNRARLKALLPNNEHDVANTDFTKKVNVHLTGNELMPKFTTDEHGCWLQCSQYDLCYAASFAHTEETRNMFETRSGVMGVNCRLYHIISYYGIFYEVNSRRKEITNDLPIVNGLTTYLKGKEIDPQTSWNGKALRGDSLANITMRGFGVFVIKEHCRRKCIQRRESCGGATVHRIAPKICYLYKYGNLTTITKDDSYESYVFEPIRSEAIEVDTTATSLNDKGEETGKKHCRKVSFPTKTYNCEPVTDTSPDVAMVLEATSMERELVHSSGRNLVPVGRYDFEKDNTGSSLPASVSKEIQISETSQQSWTTESGSDTSYTIGASATATVSAKFFGSGGSSSIGVSTEMTKGGFFSNGYSKTTTSTVQENIIVKYTVPPGRKLLINFFKETYDLQIKWRAILLASGKVRVKYLGQYHTFYISEILTLAERYIYAFGTINFGDREKIVSLAKEVDGRGEVYRQKKTKDKEITSESFNSTGESV